MGFEAKQLGLKPVSLPVSRSKWRPKQFTGGASKERNDEFSMKRLREASFIAFELDLEDIPTDVAGYLSKSHFLLLLCQKNPAVFGESILP